MASTFWREAASRLSRDAESAHTSSSFARLSSGPAVLLEQTHSPKRPCHEAGMYWAATVPTLAIPVRIMSVLCVQK